jgi:hypothetical protein
VSFAAIILCVASQRVFIVVYFIGSVRKLLDTPSYISMRSHNRNSICKYYFTKFESYVQPILGRLDLTTLIVPGEEFIGLGSQVRIPLGNVRVCFLFCSLAIG